MYASVILAPQQMTQSSPYLQPQQQHVGFNLQTGQRTSFATQNALYAPQYKPQQDLNRAYSHRNLGNMMQSIVPNAQQHQGYGQYAAAPGAAYGYAQGRASGGGMSHINCILEPSFGEGGLYLGNCTAATDMSILKRHGIKAILSVAEESNFSYPPHLGIMHKRIDAYDHETYELRNNFSSCVDFIEAARANGHNVLVHCMAGISRSSSIVIAYLMKKFNYTAEQALHHTKARRPVVKPNDGFFNQLKQYEKDLSGGFFGGFFDWFM